MQSQHSILPFEITIIEKYRAKLFSLLGSKEKTKHYSEILCLTSFLEDLTDKNGNLLPKDKFSPEEYASKCHDAACKIFFYNVKRGNKTVLLNEFGEHLKYYANSVDKSGWTPLHYAVSCGQLDITDILINNGADIYHQVQGEIQCYSLFSRAMSFDRYDLPRNTRRDLINRLLVEDKKNRDKNLPPYSDSSSTGFNNPYVESISQSLIEAARRFGEEDLIVLFYQYGGNINAQDEDGNTALHYAADRKWGSARVELLLALGADVNITNKEGKKPVESAKSSLDFYVQCDWKELVKNTNEMILALNEPPRDSSKALVNYLSRKEKDEQFSMSKSTTHPDVVKVLIHRGAKVNEKGANGKTCIQYAIDSKDTELLDTIIEAMVEKNSIQEILEAIQNENTKVYQHLCFEMGNRFLNTDLISDYIPALTFFILSGNSSESARLKVTCLLGIGNSVDKLSPDRISITDILTKPDQYSDIELDKDNLKAVISNLQPYAEKNSDAANAIGEFYYYLGDYEKALQYWKIARKKSEKSKFHITTTLKNKIQSLHLPEDHPLYEDWKVEVLLIEYENTNSEISTAARIKLFNHFFEKKNLAYAEWCATIPLLQKILFDYYFKNENYEKAARFAITPFKRLKLLKKYVEMKKYKDAARFGFKQEDYKALSPDEKTLFLMPEVRSILGRITIREIIIAHQEDNQFINKALLEKLVQEDKNNNDINQIVLVILKNKFLLATIDADTAIIYFLILAHFSSFNQQAKKDFLLNFIEVHPEISLEAVVYEDIKNKLTTQFNDTERDRFLTLVAISLGQSKIKPGELEQLQTILGDAYFNTLFTRIINSPAVQASYNDNCLIKNIYAHILLHKNNPDFDTFSAIFTRYKVKENNLHQLYSLIDNDKAMSSLNKYEWKGVLKRFAMQAINTSTYHLPIQDKIKAYNDAVQQSLFTDNRNSYLNKFNIKTNAVKTLETIKTGFELDACSEEEKANTIESISKNYSPGFFSSTQSKALHAVLQDNQVENKDKINKMISYLSEENKADRKLMNYNKKLFNLIKSSIHEYTTENSGSSSLQNG
jgi:ankyrin repeat protein